VVEDVAFHVQPAAVLQLDREPVPQGRDQRLLDRGHLVAVALDGHGVAGPQQPLLEPEQLPALPVLDDDGVAHPQDLVVDQEDPLAALVLDPEVVAEGEHLLPQQVAGTGRRPLGGLGPSCSSPEHRCPPWSAPPSHRTGCGHITRLG
jgi:hypothetical protein